MLDLESAIKHCEEVAEEQENKAKVLNGDFYQSRRNNCLECAEEHRQLAEWLRELKKWRDFGNNIGRVLGRHFSEEELFKMMEVNADEDSD